jgi:hypothetical protein
MATSFMSESRNCGHITGHNCGTPIMIVSPFSGLHVNACTSLPRRYGVAPEVFLRKLTYLRQILADLAPFQEAILAQVEAEHYKKEKLYD